MNDATLAQWLERLEQLHPKKIELGLARVTQVARSLDLLPVPQPVVTVAGTNGKGSTVAVMEALLNRVGRVTGSYTSPHFLRFNERIRVAGCEVDDSEIIEAFSAIDEARGDISLTYFEFATLASLWVFRARQVDVVLLEVGLGGRLDAVNIVDASVAVITRIDLDHQDWLGDSLDGIAREKAGVLRAGRPAVIADPAPPAGLANAVADSGAAPVFRLGKEFTVCADKAGWQILLAGPQGKQRCLPPAANNALMPENFAGALQAITALGVSFTDEDAQAAVAETAPTGRRQQLQIEGRTYLLDVAHNPSAVDKLVEYIDATPCSGKTLTVFSVMRDKDVSEMIARVEGRFDGWFLADQPGNARAATASELASRLHEAGQGPVSVSDNLRQAFRRAESLMQSGDRLVIFGSFYTVAGVMPSLEKAQRKREANR
ncbi:MAG: dihydrofolate synthase/folylpolyglutamate synthase [Bacteroidia bacterium]|jgi:dihydrofolate synthase/folylpolyglutamate synthase